MKHSRNLIFFIYLSLHILMLQSAYPKLKRMFKTETREQMALVTTYLIKSICFSKHMN